MAPRRPALAQAAAPLPRRSARLRPPADPPNIGKRDHIDHAGRIIKRKAKKPAKQDCSTCGRTLSQSSFPKHLTSGCTHDVNTCKACCKSWVGNQLDTTTYDEISCPECPATLESADVKRLATNDVYDKYEGFERRGIAEKTPGWRWCLAPGCQAGQVHQPLLEISPNSVGLANPRKGKGKSEATKSIVDNNICTCNECGAQACVNCDRPYHDGETCLQFQKRKMIKDREDEASLVKIAAGCKKCPNAKCGKNIERNGGCDHMVCTQCRTAFCWLCLTTYTVINQTGHANGCNYARPNRIDPHALGAPNNGPQGFFAGLVGMAQDAFGAGG